MNFFGYIIWRLNYFEECIISWEKKWNEMGFMYSEYGNYIGFQQVISQEIKKVEKKHHACV